MYVLSVTFIHSFDCIVRACVGVSAHIFVLAGKFNRPFNRHRQRKRNTRLAQRKRNTHNYKNSVFVLCSSHVASRFIVFLCSVQFIVSIALWLLKCVIPSEPKTNTKMAAGAVIISVVVSFV